MRGLRYVLRLLLVPTLAATGAVAGYAGEGSLISTTLLLWEPALWVGAAWAVWGTWRAGDGGLALGLASGGLAAAIAAHVPAAPAEPEGMDAAPFVRTTRTCLRGLPLPVDPVRLTQWTVSGDSPGLAAAITDTAPQVAVVFGPISGDMEAAITAGVGGESLRIEGEDAPIHLFASGVFNLCGEADQWVDRPATGTDVGLVFVALPSGTSFPLLVARLPEPGAVPQWSSRTAEARGALRATVDSMQSSLLIAAISAVAPLSAPRLTRTFLAVGLSPVARPLNWPRWSPLRLHAFDQVWGAEGWVGVRTGLAPGGDARDGITVDLAPRWPVVLPAAGDDDPVR